MVLIALFVFDALAFGLEIKKHGWSRAAKVECAGLGVLLLLGLGDWHLQTLAAKHDAELAARVDAARDAAKAAHDESAAAKVESKVAKAASEAATAESLAAKTKATELQQQIAPFLKIAKSSYPTLPDSEAIGRLATEVETIRSRTDRLDAKSTALEAKASSLEKKSTDLAKRIEPRVLSHDQASAISAFLRTQASGHVQVEWSGTIPRRKRTHMSSAQTFAQEGGASPKGKDMDARGATRRSQVSGSGPAGRDPRCSRPKQTTLGFAEIVGALRAANIARVAINSPLLHNPELLLWIDHRPGPVSATPTPQP